MSAITQRYFLIEAINIANNVFDTDQLSIIRGSSFLLKEAIIAIKKEEVLSKNLVPISTGASSGFFQCKENAASSSTIQINIKHMLEAHQGYTLFTFAIEYCEAESLLIAKEKLRTQLRRNQLRSLSIPTDPTYLETNPKPCELDGRRLQAQTPKAKRMLQNKERQLSASLYERLSVGRSQRANYYQQELGDQYLDALDDYHFSEDLESLAESDQFPKLDNKIAVIYIDGNQFGKIQNKLIAQATDSEQAQAQRQFDQTIQQDRRDFLATLLSKMISDDDQFPDAHYTTDSKKVLRLETLLWGGDEMTLVVPAWLGFAVIQCFFQSTAESSLTINGKSQPLTHAAGLVFCSAKSPIRIMRNLAESIANGIKEETREANRWNYIILESIDYPTTNNFNDYWEERYKSLGIHKPNTIAPLPSQDWQQQKERLQALIQSGDLPRGQLYHLIEAIKHDTATAANLDTMTWDDLFTAPDESPAQSEQIQKEQRLLQLGDKQCQARLQQQLPILAEQLFSITDLNSTKHRTQFWLHLIETWDYLTPHDSKAGEALS